MRLLAFSDLHRNRCQGERLVELAQQADAVVGGGDFASMRLGLRRTIDMLGAITQPVVLVPGNHESEAELRRACAGWPSATILHGEGKQIGGVQFFGLGAGVPPTPFPWSFDLAEEEAEVLLEPCPDGAVLVVHSPPKGYLDEAHDRHLGSEAILRAIDRTHPVLALCGHIHEAWGTEAMVGSTRVVNLGPEGTFFEL